MPAQLGKVLVYTLVPVVASGLGGVIAAFWPPSPTVRSVVQHFAAGVVLAAAALELLPPVRQRSPWVAVIGFALGIVAMLALRLLTTRAESQKGAQGTLPLGLISATGVDILIDGLVVGSGFASAEQTGLLLIVALVMEFLFLGLSVAAALGGVSRWLIIAIPIGLSCLVLVGAGVGVVALQNASAPVVAAVLAFGAVALMYLVTEELLTEAHKSAETSWSVTLFFLGFLTFLVITQLLG